MLLGPGYQCHPPAKNFDLAGPLTTATPVHVLVIRRLEFRGNGVGLEFWILLYEPSPIFFCQLEIDVVGIAVSVFRLKASDRVDTRLSQLLGGSTDCVQALLRQTGNLVLLDYAGADCHQVFLLFRQFVWKFRHLLNSNYIAVLESDT